MDFKNKIDKAKLPVHVAIIMDGNGRWAQGQGMPRIYGHHNGVKAVRDCSEAAAEIGIKYLTLYAFSTENWNRPEQEVNALMALLVETIGKEVKTLNDNNIRLQAIGDLPSLPRASYQALLKGIRDTAHNDGMTLVLALNYSSRWEIKQAVKSIASQVKQGLLNPEEIDEEKIAQSLATKDYPDPDLLIRTSGEQRLSNFLLWQCAYTEFYFTPVFWPDIDKEEFWKAIYDYQLRERRYGMTSAQIMPDQKTGS
ncbi:MAG: isoprenyl transferase [Saprospiraceae bacterium]